MGWTKWYKLADKKNFYDHFLDYDGPACYEIAVGGPRRGNLVTVYVGETINEKRRMIQYARYGSHLSKLIDRHVNNGWCIYYRAQAKNTKKQAVKMQNCLLASNYYCWNKQRILY